MSRKKQLYSGLCWSKKNHKNIFYESSYEYRAIRMMEIDPFVLNYERCGLSIPIPIMGKDFRGDLRQLHYNPDFIVTFADGKKYIIEVKAKNLLKDSFVQVKLKTILDMIKYLDLNFMVWTEKELGFTSTKGGKIN
jgi:hypothetical protein